MLDISVIILTFNEEIHIKRCIERIFVIDCFSTDNTAEIANKLGAVVVTHAWPGNHAAQINWALDNLPIDTQWVLRLDADEYLLPELIEELQSDIPKLPAEVTGINLKRRHVFLGKWIKHGTYPIIILRIFRTGKAKCDQRLMDEHIVLKEGYSICCKNDFVDHNLNTLFWWIEKHNNYALREAVELLDIKYNIIRDKQQSTKTTITTDMELKKIKYVKMPIFLRAFGYFILRYIIKGGILEGKEGFLWHSLQGLWYRTLVDAKIFEITKACGSDRIKIRQYLLERHKMVL
ncbi:MAG: glycosyltransferase family 2 protein [Bacteroidales bacterium]